MLGRKARKVISWMNPKFKYNLVSLLAKLVMSSGGNLILMRFI